MTRLIIHLADEEMAKKVIPTEFLCREVYSSDIAWMSVSSYIRNCGEGDWTTKKFVCPHCLASEDFDLMLLKHLP